MSSALQESVRIGPEFFQNAVRDYADKYWAFAREILQNAMDSDGSDQIHITVQLCEGDLSNTEVIVKDNGRGMDEDILRNKLLTLGGSGKAFQNGKVGGFGKAKEILYFGQKRYLIETQNLVVSGSGAQFDLDRRPYTCVEGCNAFVVWEGDVRDELNEAFQKFCRYAQWGGSVTLNGWKTATSLHKGHFRRELPFGRIYTNKTFENRAIVRMHGIPMFTSSTNFDGTVICELTGENGGPLTANRDGLSYPFNNHFQKFLTELSTDKRSALRTREAEYRLYAGPKITVEKLLELGSGSLFLGDQCIGAVSDVKITFGEPRVIGIQETKTFLIEAPPVRIGSQFIVKNTTNPRLETPAKFQADSPEFSDYSLFLANAWIRCLIELHRLFDMQRSFSAGFLLDAESEAEFQKHNEYGDVYYINPAKIVKPEGGGRRFQHRFRKSEKHRILSIAVHEFVHGMGHSCHDEDYANRLTEVMGIVMANQKRFRAAFRKAAPKKAAANV